MCVPAAGGDRAAGGVALLDQASCALVIHKRARLDPGDGSLHTAASWATFRALSRFADRCKPFPRLGAGVGCVLHEIRDGRPWREAATFGGQGSCGNGAVMRVAPLGAYVVGRLVEEAADETPHLARRECVCKSCTDLARPLPLNREYPSSAHTEWH